MKRLLTLNLAIFLVASSAASQPFDLSWFALGGGGTASGGGSFTLSGTIGQSATDTLAGGSYTLTGGFWSVAVAIQMPDAPLLQIRRVDANVVISWSAPPSAFSLEETTNLGAADSWKPNATPPKIDGADHAVTLPALPGERFFRLKRKFP
jgi:hypothetical protein